MEDRCMDFEREALISREYEIVVFYDGSTDATAETLQPYGDVLPTRGRQIAPPSTVAT